MYYGFLIIKIMMCSGCFKATNRTKGPGEKKTGDLKSSSLEVGRYADHIIEFENGTQKTFKDIDNKTINVGKFTKMKNKSGVLIGVAHDKVNFYEVHSK